MWAICSCKFSMAIILACSLSRWGRVIFFLLLLFGLKLLLNHKLALLLSHLGLSSLVSICEICGRSFCYRDLSLAGISDRCFFNRCLILLDFSQLYFFLSRAFSRSRGISRIYLLRCLLLLNFLLLCFFVKFLIYIGQLILCFLLYVFLLYLLLSYILCFFFDLVFRYIDLRFLLFKHNNIFVFNLYQILCFAWFKPRDNFIHLRVIVLILFCVENLTRWQFRIL